ncbi:TetR/AcrR family transcriptional regulator [Paracoccus caeni]|uniref:TetR/AcrR family transcriptional regulator n=1 Tax=Paracoccus caeni TaxID=657651 RepID=A0A934SLK6_9RHOB|nr:TetR/AcrR family transcriptional regulator [Paracoccus caeni]MBK4217462.1 TetR/AcrR family transcriptional regulator [Paracoccus caeni]
MPRPKTQTDESVLDAALMLMQTSGPDGLTFASLASATGLSAATLVQRFGNKTVLKSAALHQAWDRLDEATATTAERLPQTPGAAIDLLIALSGDYGDIETYAEGLLLLREDLRDPALRQRGTAWKTALTGHLDACFTNTPDTPPNIGELLATHWQGALLWWSFDPQHPVEAYLRDSLTAYLALLIRT